MIPPLTHVSDAAMYFASKLALEIDPADVARDMRSGIVDYVRGAASSQAGHLPGARNLPVDSIDDRAVEELPEGMLVLYCWGPPLSSLVIEAETVRQIFNDTPDEALWLVVGSPAEAANTLEMTDAQLAVLYPDGPKALPPELSWLTGAFG